MATKQPKYGKSDYPGPVQATGESAMLAYDRLEQALLDDGYTMDEASMLLDINLEKVLAEAKQTEV